MSATAQSVHATTALGNERGRKQRQFAAAVASEQEWSAAKSPDVSLEDDEDADIVRSDASKAFDKAQVVKVDSDLGLVFGFAIVCKKDGQDYFDLQGDHITEKAMLESATDFMVNSRVAKEMHDGAPVGSVVFAFPLTSDIAKALDVTTNQTGLLIAMKPSADVLAKFKDGSYTGFSIGGSRIKDEDVADG